MVINYCKNENEQNMLLNLYKKKWNHGLKNLSVTEAKKSNNEALEEMVRLTKDYSGWIKQENLKTIKEFSVSSIGKLDPKRHLMEVFGLRGLIFRVLMNWKKGVFCRILG
jgi:26S proteasome regulatory subunit N11